MNETLSPADQYGMSTLPDDMANVIERLNRIEGKIEVGFTHEEPRSGTDKLFAALAKAQGEMHNAEHDATNPHYGSSYATLASCLSAVREPLSKNGLSLMQLPGRKVENGTELLTLTTILGHTSGQCIENYFEMYPPKRDPQGIGSAMTYMRRYALMAICGISGAADDDAEGTLPDAETITAAEADEILALADELFGSDADALLARMCDKIFGVESVPKIPAGEASIALQRIKNTKARKDREKEEGGKSETKPAKKKPGGKPADDDVPRA